MASQVSGDLRHRLRTRPAGGPYAAATAISDSMPADEATPSTRPDASRVAFGRGSPATSSTPSSTAPTSCRSPPTRRPTSARPPTRPTARRSSTTPDARLLVAASGGANPEPLPIGNAGGTRTTPTGRRGDVKPPETKITKAPKARTEKRTANVPLSVLQRARSTLRVQARQGSRSAACSLSEQVQAPEGRESTGSGSGDRCGRKRRPLGGASEIPGHALSAA